MHEQEIYCKFNDIIQIKNAFEFCSHNNEEAMRFFGIFNYCLNSLKEEYRLILTKSYLDNSYQFWWLDYFCKSSYYRKRYWAIVAFVRLFEMIHENFNDTSNYFNYSDIQKH